MYVVLIKRVVQVDNDDVFPPSELVEHIVRSGHRGRDVGDQLVYGSEID